MEVGRDRRQQAHGHEFGGDQREHAQRHCEHAAPISRLCLGLVSTGGGARRGHKGVRHPTNVGARRSA
jgi:hypothetical protein